MILLRQNYYSEKKKKIKKEDVAQVAATVGVAGSSVLAAGITKKKEDERAIDHFNNRKNLLDRDQFKEEAITNRERYKELDRLEKSNLVREKNKLNIFINEFDQETRDRGLSGTRRAEHGRLDQELDELTEQYKQHKQQINDSAKKELGEIKDYYREASDKLAKEKDAILKKNKKAMRNRALIGVAAAVPIGFAAREIVKRSKKKDNRKK